MQITERRSSVATRRFGYVLATAITVVGWLVINEWPGWQELSVLTNEAPAVLWLVNFSLAVSVAVNLVYAVYDPPWVKSLGDLVTTSIGLLCWYGCGRCFRSTSANTRSSGPPSPA